VDPEDLEAHYNLMLCYRGLNDDALAAREEKLYLRFKADEASRAITGPFKLAHSDDNNESQPVHEHVSGPLGLVKPRTNYAQARPGAASQRDSWAGHVHPVSAHPLSTAPAQPMGGGAAAQR
jgi:hypothetical protein